MKSHEVRKAFKVTRFHTIPMLKENTLGEHSANVATLFLCLAHDFGIEDHTLLYFGMKVALTHDLPEKYTGDMPANFKWDRSDAFKSELKYVEKELEEKLPPPLRGKYNLPTRSMSNVDREKVLWLVKFADTLDLIMQCVDEMELGNAGEIKKVAYNGYTHLEENHIPDNPWRYTFMPEPVKNCIDSLYVQLYSFGVFNLPTGENDG